MSVESCTNSENINNKPIVLIADSDVFKYRTTECFLKENKLEPVIVSNFGDLNIRIGSDRVDLLVINPQILELPFKDYEPVKRIPTIVVANVIPLRDKVAFFEAGADQCVEFPVSEEVFTAQIRAILRRPVKVPMQAPRHLVGDVSLDFGTSSFLKAGELVFLTQTEQKLLKQLCSDPGRNYLKNELLTKVWGPEYVDDTQYLNVWIARIRKKLGFDLIIHEQTMYRVRTEAA